LAGRADRHDDYKGYRRLVRELAVPIQIEKIFQKATPCDVDGRRRLRLT
jgi:hypothetical protein